MSELVEAIEATRVALLDAGAITPADAAALHLAECYARELDGADAAARRADRVAAEVADREGGRESALYEEVDALRKGLSRRQALDRIGDRLHRILVDLHAVPRGRVAAGTPPGAGAVAGKLGKLVALKGGSAGA